MLAALGANLFKVDLRGLSFVCLIGLVLLSMYLDAFVSVSVWWSLLFRSTSHVAP